MRDQVQHCPGRELSSCMQNDGERRKELMRWPRQLRWTEKLTNHVFDAVAKCKALPPGYKFTKLSMLIKLVALLLVEIQCTLAFLLRGCGICSRSRPAGRLEGSAG